MTQEQKILKGFALLDKDRPGWEKEIDLDRLDMKNQCDCTLGQIYSNYNKGSEALQLIGYGSDFGFWRDSYTNEDDDKINNRWQKLTAKVKKLIKERLC